MADDKPPFDDESPEQPVAPVKPSAKRRLRGISIRPSKRRRLSAAAAPPPVPVPAGSEEPQPTILSMSRELAVIERKRRSMKVASTLSISRVQTAANGGYPTIFRPQVGAVGGNTNFQAKRGGNVALFVTALVTIIAANSAPMDKLVHALQAERPTASATQIDQTPPMRSIFQPLFGPEAVNRCAETCRESNVESVSACERACAKLSLSEYARRILVVDDTPELDVERIVLSCERTPLPDRRHDNRMEWETEARSAVQLMKSVSTAAPSGDFAKSRLFFADLSSVLTELRLPPGATSESKERAVTDRLLRATCLRAHLTLTELALVLVRQNGDEFSHRYYSRLKKLLHPPTIRAEETALKNGKTLSNSSTRPS